MSTPNPDTALDDIVPVQDLAQRLQDVLTWIETQFWSVDVAIQLGVILAAFLPAIIFGPRIRDLVQASTKQWMGNPWIRRPLSALLILMTPLALYLVLTGARVAFGAVDRPTAVLEAALSLLTAWLVIRAVTLVIRSKFWSSVAFYIAWPVAALDVFGLLDDVMVQLQMLAIPLGETEDGEPVQLSLLDIIRTLIYFGALI